MAKMYIDTPHLIFKNNESQKNIEIKIQKEDIKILQELAKKYVEIAMLPIQAKRKNMWKNLNDLKDVKPLIWVNEVCWNEMNINDELTLKTSSEFCQRIETKLRRRLYQWKHMPGDMIIEPTIYSPYIVNNSGIGIETKADIKETEKGREIASRHFHIQIKNEDDLEKIKEPKITYNRKRTQDFYEAYCKIFDGIINIGKRGSPGFWFAPWDDIVTWTGMEETYMKLISNPELMHKLIDKVVTVYIKALKQYEEKKLLASNNTNVRIGSGAYGYTNELPQNNKSVNLNNIWGACAAQPFAEVSPQMHKEFGIDYEKRWLEKFGLTYYGCCEPLDDRINLLKSITNLRKISVSPWANMNAIVPKVTNNYVISLKPNPNVLAASKWDPDRARKELEKKLNIVQEYDCNVEIIMKDISTVRHEPQRLWEWTEIATKVAKDYI